ncbi:nucleotidyltransferase domain-containing protein, partial [Streptomyces sp. NPDC102451]|uniref:nucleotidyltransferase domain-containing protein n=1 Tax=Streptomyces sp. NPDC102451 TaxID=3366177 RepID=UPI00382CBB9A
GWKRFTATSFQAASQQARSRCHLSAQQSRGWKELSLTTYTSYNRKSGYSKAVSLNVGPKKPPEKKHWAMGTGPGAHTAQASSAGLPDLPCAVDDGLCDVRNALFKVGVATGMTGGAIGFFGLRGSSIERKFDVPQGISSGKFSEISAMLREKGVGDIGKLSVQGSRASQHVGPDSDLDIAVLVPPRKFDRMIAESFGTPNSGSSRDKTRIHAIRVGKITAGDVKPRLSRVRDALQETLGMKVDLSVIKIGGEFDDGPYIDIR